MFHLNCNTKTPFKNVRINDSVTDTHTARLSIRPY